MQLVQKLHFSHSILKDIYFLILMLVFCHLVTDSHSFFLNLNNIFEGKFFFNLKGRKCLR